MTVGKKMTFINWEDLPFEEDLTISGFTTIKSRIKHYNDQNHTRAVWENKEKGVILKIWPKNYIRGEYFHQAYKSGFFNDMENHSSIQIIIADRENCRGYSMKKGEKLTEDEKKDDKILKHFSNRLIEKVKKTGFFYYDLSFDNLRKFGSEYCLIDLDSIYPLNEYQEWRDGKHRGGEMVKYEPYKSQLDELAKKIQGK